MFSSYLRVTTQALHWDRGRPARYKQREVRRSRKSSTSDVLLALRAHCGRAARGPSEEIEWSIQRGALPQFTEWPSIESRFRAGKVRVKRLAACLLYRSLPKLRVLQPVANLACRRKQPYMFAF
jgi:hypothetical protein